MTAGLRIGTYQGMQTIQEYWLKIKAIVDTLLAEWGMFAIIVLAVVGSFGLGRLSILIVSKPPVSISQAAAAVADEPMNPGGYYVGSKTGTTYYFPWCIAAQKIPVTQERWFVSENEAKRAGYYPAKNCK